MILQIFFFNFHAFFYGRIFYHNLNGQNKNRVNLRCHRIDSDVQYEPTDLQFSFSDVVSIERTGEHFRLIYDVKGRFTVHRISPEEATYKLCRVRRVQTGPKGVPFIVTHDGRTIQYPDPLIKVCYLFYSFQKSTV